MSAAIVLTGLASNDPVPGNYLEIQFAQGQAAGDSSPRETILMGNKTSSGSATLDTQVYGPDTPIPLQTEADCIALFGAGSELHLGFRKFTQINQVTTLRAIAVTESAGANATATITIATTPTGNGNVRVFFGGAYYDTGFLSGDTVTTIALAVCATLNAATWLPFTAGPVAGVITLTAKNKGPRSNNLRVQTSVTPGVATTVSLGADTAFSGGTTADSNAAALGTMLPNEYYRIVSSANDATQLGAVQTQINNQAQPIVGIRQRLFAGSVDTIANAITLATGLNAVRGEIVWQKFSQYTEFELACTVAAVVSLFEDSGEVPRCNFAGFGNDAVTANYWSIKASRTQSAYPTRTDIKSALNNGLSPIGVNSNGTTYLVNRITTRSLSGAVQDYRIRDSHKVTICDFFAKDLLAKVNLQFPGKLIADNPPPGADPPGGDVVTPDLYKSCIFGLINRYAKNNLLQRVDGIKSGTVTQRSTVTPTRMEARIPLDTIDIFLQSANLVLQVG